MRRSGQHTRTAIMDAAEGLILMQGFSATSVEQVIERAGITKGAFFYHFPTKNELAHALVERYAALDRQHLEDKMERAVRLSRDPLQQVLIFVGLFQEAVAGLAESEPGCLFASYCYEVQLFDERTLEVIREALRLWRERLGAKFREVMAVYPPRLPVDADELADMITGTFEGAFVLARTLEEPRQLEAQLAHYRNYLELLFAPEPGGRPA